MNRLSTTDSWTAPINVARAEVVDANGRTVELTPDNSGVRRAEIEGQLDRFRAEPGRLASLAEAYRTHNPQAPHVTAVRVLLRHNEYNRRIFELIQADALQGQGVVLSLTDCYRRTDYGEPINALKSYILSPFSDEQHVNAVLESIWKARRELAGPRT